MSGTAAEIRTMTGVRGAAAFFVMIYHFHLKLVASGPLSTILLHGYLAVDLFFVLSGFVMGHVYGQAFMSGTFRQRDFLLHRLARIYPLYLTMTLIFAAMALVHAGVDTAALPELASNILMLQALGNWPSIDPPAWSVSTEMLAYLLFPLIAMAGLKSGRWTASLLGLASLLAILALTVAAGRHEIGSPVAKGELDLFFSPYTVIRCLAGFTLGLLIYRIRRAGSLTRLVSANIVQLAVLALVLVSMAQALSDFPTYLALMALILILAEDTGITRRIFASPPLMLLGKLSFGIYLLHFKAIGLVDALRARALEAGFGAAASDWMATLTACALVTALAWVLHRAIERPIRTIIRSLQAPGAAADKTRALPQSQAI